MANKSGESSARKWTAKHFIERYSMQKHEEGGWFSEIYRNDETYDKLPERYGKDAIRNLGTHIYYMLTDDDFSCFRRLESDELWHFYAGTEVLVTVIEETTGKLSTHVIGPQDGEFILVVKRGDYCASRLVSPEKDNFGLLGMTVVPGYEYADCAMPKAEHLLKLYPQHSETIKTYTRT